MCAYQSGFENKKPDTMLLRVFVDFVVSRHEVFVRFRLCPFSAHDEDGDIGGEAGQASDEPHDILRDVDEVTTVRILPSLKAVDAHDGGDLGDEHLLNLRHSLKALGFFLSPLQRLHLCVCGRARYRKPKCAGSCSSGTVAQWLRMYLLVLEPSRSEFKSPCVFVLF